MKLPSSLIALGIALLAMGCSDPATPTVGELPNVSGDHTLESISGEPLPVLRYYSDSYDTEIDFVGGTLTFRPDSTFLASYLLKYTRGTMGGRVAAGEEYTMNISGTYSVYGDSIRYSFQVDKHDLSFGLAIREGIIEGPSDGAALGEFTR